MDRREGGRCLIRQENATRAKAFPKYFLSPNSQLLRWESLRNQKVGRDGKLEPITSWLYIQMQHNHEKANTTPRQGFLAETGSISTAQQEYWQEYQVHHYRSLVRKDALKWKQVQRARVMGWWACLPTADWKRMQSSKERLKENLTAGFKYARRNERNTHGKKRTEIRTKKLTCKKKKPI